MEDHPITSRREQLLLNTTWIFLLSSILHFLYQFTKLPLFSYISAVNESVWEHTKIIFFAALLFDVFLYIKNFRGNKNFLTGLAPALFSILISVPLLFYGYSSVLEPTI